ncbi:MAG: beta-lactamase family protein, partial [Cyanobacteria bacterium]|nr:beta-lactamase family protein [Cyanobacteriota bacterium]
KFQYSGEGYFYLQRVLEAVTGKGIGEVLQQLVFDPLAMTSTSLICKPDWLPRTARPYDQNGDLRKNWDRPPRLLTEVAAKRGQSMNSWKYADYAAVVKELGGGTLPSAIFPNGASSMVTTATDYSRFLAAAITNSEITKHQVPLRPMLSWGLGWGVEQFHSRTFLWQWGDNGGFKNIVIAEPARGEALFVFTNSDNGAKFYEWIVRTIHRIEHPLFLWL